MGLFDYMIDAVQDRLKTLRAYAFGRGIVSLGVVVAGAIASFSGMGLLLPAAVAIGGIGMQAFMRVQRQRVYEDAMVDLYRDDIAAHLNLAPDQVTRAHLKEAAQDNEVIDQALKRQRHKSAITFATSALAGLVTFGLLASPLPGMLGNLFSSMPGEGLLEGILKFGTFGMIAGTSSLIVHDGLEAVIGAKTGVSKAAAHDRIVEMERGMRRGWGVSKQQVYGVLVAGNPSLQQAIAKKFGRDYSRMAPTQQEQVLQEIGVADDMQVLANEINQNRCRPGHLAYMIGDASTPYRARRAQAHPDLVEQTIAPARSFVEKLNIAPREHQSHTARLDADRAMAALGERSV